MIPKIIHYCWFGEKKLPKDVKTCIESWEKKCPEYKIICWNESNFDIHCHPFVEKAYESKEWAFVSDYARLKIIYDNGGIYLDTDVELLKSLDEVVENECYFAVQQNGAYVATGLGFGSIAGHRALESMLKEYDNIVFDVKKKYEFSCPYLNTAALEAFGYKRKNEIQFLSEGVVVYPPCYFDPYSSGDSKDLMCEKTISIHHYSATWTSGKQRLKRKISRLIGEKNILKIKALIK